MINLNGNLKSVNNSISANNRGFLYGDGVFDVIKYSAGKLFFWEEHYLRLMASMRILRMNIPDIFTLEYLENEILKTIQANELTDKTVKVSLIIVRAEGGEYTPDNFFVDYCIQVQELSSPFYQNLDIPYEVELYKDFYVQADLLSTLKTTNRLINIVGSIFAQENDYQNCILLNHQKNVVGFLNGNLFLVVDNQIITPPLTDGAINGITRKKLIDVIKKTNEYSIIEKTISPFDLQKADELFLTNTTLGIQSVSKYRKKEFQNKIAKNILGKLNTIARLE